MKTFFFVIVAALGLVSCERKKEPPPPQSSITGNAVITGPLNISVPSATPTFTPWR